MAKTSKVTQISKLKLVSQKQLGDLESKLVKTYGRMGMKIYINELGHMTNLTNMPAMPIYSKNRKKSSFPEPIDR